MKVAIAYYSRHHGNTKKLLDAIKGLADVKLIDVVETKAEDISAYDLIGFASGVYFNNFHKAVIQFAKENLPNNKSVFLIHTYGWKIKDYTKEMKEVFKEKSCKLLGTYGCRGFDTFGPLKLIGGIAKGRPNEKDKNGVIEFFTKIIEK
ncbi:MAG TPA: flavodoxin [Acholeplasmataceae bacterium]|jgi:flavodoxin|nr:flavodoxin [Acholeplasmataceae bacterium]